MADYLLRDVLQLMAGQGGATTRSQLVNELGVPRSTLTGWILAGRMVPEGDRVLRSGAVPASRELALRIALLEVGQEAVLSHHTAVRLWGLWGWSEGEPVHLQVARRAKHLPDGVVLHHTRLLAPEDRVEIDGLPVTSLERAICDVAGTVRARTVADLVADGASRGLLDLGELETCVAARRRFPGRGKVTAALLGFDGDQSRYRSKLERRSRNELVASGAPAPRINFPVRLEGRISLLDHAWPALRYDVELDGPHHLRPSQREEDARRDRILGDLGWVVDRFWWPDVEAGLHVPQVLARLRELDDRAR